MRKITLIILVGLLSTMAYSQKFSIHLGDKQFNQFNYLKAAEYYEHALKKDSSNLHVLRRLGESYHKMGDNSKAVDYLMLLTQSSDCENQDRLYFGNLYKEIGEYTNARIQYETYLRHSPEDKKVSKLVEQMKMLENVMLPNVECKIQLAKANSEFSDFAPTYYKEDLVFSSARKIKRFRSDRYGWNGQFFLELFQAPAGDTTGMLTKRFAKGIGSKYHEGVVCFSTDYKRMFFTRSNYYKGKLRRDDEGVNNLKIFIAEEQNGKWNIVDEFPYNSDDYSVGHPSLSEDNQTLYFVSDMPGTIGGTDLYKSTLVNGQWSKPQNLGEHVNSIDNEMFPHYDNGVLYFASNGHGGKGGLDLYMYPVSSKKLTHLGSPINSGYDDFALVMNKSGNGGYFSTNRPGGKGDDDIYSFLLSDKNGIEIQVRNRETDEIIRVDEFLINGKVDDEFKFDETNMSYKKEIKRLEKYDLQILKQSFITKDTALYANMWDSKQKSILYLSPIPVIEEVVQILPDTIAPIYFDFDQANIDEKAYQTLNELAVLMKKNETLTITVLANTDVRGSELYNQLLAEKRAKSTVQCLGELGIDKDRILIKILGESHPLKQLEKQSETRWHKLNRRVDIELNEITME